MLHDDNDTLRAIRRDDLLRLWQFNNDLEVELAGGGDPPVPQSLERLTADFERTAVEGGRDGAYFVIKVERKCVGSCGLSSFNWTSGAAELGIGIGDKHYRASDTVAKRSSCCCVTHSSIATCAASGSGCAAATSARSAPTRRADLSRRAASASMSGATGSTMTRSVWAC